MNLDFEDLNILDKVKGTQDGAKTGSDDSDKWEMDTDVVLDRLYHSWLGEKLNEKGIWERDPKLKKMMNEKGASMLISEINTRFNINMQFSLLDINEIREIVADTMEAVNNVLMYDYWKYDIDPLYIKNVIEQIWHSLYIWLKIPFGGGMRNYKGDKTKTIISKREDKEISEVY